MTWNDIEEQRNNNNNNKTTSESTSSPTYPTHICILKSIYVHISMFLLPKLLLVLVGNIFYVARLALPSTYLVLKIPPHLTRCDYLQELWELSFFTENETDLSSGTMYLLDDSVGDPVHPIGG